MRASWIFKLKKLLQTPATSGPDQVAPEPQPTKSFLKTFRQLHKNSSRYSKDELANFFFQVQKAKCERNVLFLKRFLMPEVYQKFQKFVTECEQDALELEINCVKFKNFLIHSPDGPPTGQKRIYILLEYSLQECWSDLRSNFKKDQFHDVIEVWELLYSEQENKFYLYWIYNLEEASDLEMEHLFESLKAA